MQPLTPRVKKAFSNVISQKAADFRLQLRCDVSFWRLQKCPPLPMTAARNQLHPTILKTRNRFVLNRARGFESHHLRQKSQIQTNLRLFYFALLLLGMQKHRQKPGRRCPFSPKFSPTGTLTGRLLNLLKILLFVETAVSLHPLEYVTSAADTISVPNGGRECKDVTPEPCCRVRIR